MGCAMYDCRCRKTSPCPRCEKVVHVSGPNISYHGDGSCPSRFDPRSTNVMRPKLGAGCRATTQKGDPCPIDSRPSGWCHVHDPDGKAQANKRRKHRHY